MTLDTLADLSSVAYLLVFVMALLDVVVPILPSETAVVLGAVLAWQGRLHPVPLVLVAAAGAFCGDHLSYGLGRWSQRALRVRRETSKVARLQRWAAHQLEARGPIILIVARFIPGGRTASTFVTGRVSYPLARFTPITAVAAVLWALFGTALGYLGGSTFHDNTILATLLGVAVGTAVAAFVQFVVMRLGHHNHADAKPATAAPGKDDDIAA
jgi:membrane protein DedA with SNARE-associated domain